MKIVYALLVGLFAAVVLLSNVDAAFVDITKLMNQVAAETENGQLSDETSAALKSVTSLVESFSYGSGKITPDNIGETYIKIKGQFDEVNEAIRNLDKK